jgi:hypothetical protein
MTKEVNRNSEYMKEQWGTEFLSSDYGWEYRIYKKNPIMLREIVNDDSLPKKHNFDIQNELHAKIRNDDDYDDWEYGTEPLYKVTK